MAMDDEDWMRQGYLPAVGQYIRGSQYGTNASATLMNRPRSQYGTPAAGKRLTANQLDTYQIPLPEGGFSTIRVAAGSRAPVNAQPYKQFVPNPTQMASIREQGKAQGYGPTASFNPQTQTQSYAGVETPVEQLNAAQRYQYGAPTTTQTVKENPFAAFSLLQNPLAMLNPLASNALNSVASIFRENRQRPQYTYQRPQTSAPRSYFDPSYNYGF